MTIPDWYTAGAVRVFLVLAGPGLALCLALGVTGSIVQTTTQIRESALGFVPKVAGLVLMIALAGGLMLHFTAHYTVHVFRSLPEIVHVDNNNR